MSDWWHSMIQFFQDQGAGLWLKSLAALMFGGVMSLFDMAHPSVRPLAWLMLLDFGLGAAQAIRAARFSFAGIKRGVAKFLFYALALAITSLADWGVDAQLFGGSPLTWALCVYLITCEALSCLRHLAVFGGPSLPAWLFERLEFLKQSIEHPQRRREDWRVGPPDQPLARPNKAEEHNDR